MFLLSLRAFALSYLLGNSNHTEKQEFCFIAKPWKHYAFKAYEMDSLQRGEALFSLARFIGIFAPTMYCGITAQCTLETSYRG